ncbi:uncharacterized protein LOC117785569 [Drosophila innubila]|uniref:uncharacterized protein LOC117785569 n=1 Tax=Drosophila innubila TaxID=198719 RepID=UPI00148E79B3|nr:uncharacterized protein LOC117785569 [Drosophila innubila]
MPLKAVNALLLGFVAWNICEAETRLCAVTKDDRIVFPDDKSEAIQIWNTTNISLSNSTELPLNTTTTLSLDKLNTDSDLDSDSEPDSNSTTTTELPVLDNRILVDTLPVCGPGFQLRAGRCRKSA